MRPPPRTRKGISHVISRLISACEVAQALAPHHPEDAASVLLLAAQEAVRQAMAYRGSVT